MVNGEFFLKYEKAFDFRWVLVKSRPCTHNTIDSDQLTVKC